MTIGKYESEKQLKGRAFEEEREKLESVVGAIKSKRVKLSATMPATAAHQQTADAIQKILNGQSESFLRAIDQPYFGRLDYVHRGEGETKQVRTIYLGGAAILDENVFNWTAPVGRLWYTQSYEDGYTAPKGHIATRVDLKRHLKIREGHLEDLTDIFKRHLPAASDGREELLLEKLSGSGADDGQLVVIIETIEPEQYESIANVDDKVLIVQGAAGSGKSEIGLHRIAFLLSPFNQIPENERPTPETTLLVGPSHAFLKNVDDVLPNLGLADGVERVRFSEWLSGNLSSSQVRFQPRILNNLQQYGEMRGYDEAAETFKGSLDMAYALERYVSERTRRIKAGMNGIGPLLGPDGEARVTARQVKDTLADVLPGRGGFDFPNRRREAFIDRICGIVERGSQSLATAERHASAGSAVRYRRLRYEVERNIRRAVVAWCGTTWPQLDFRSEYTALLSDAHRIAELAPKGELSAETARALAVSVSKNTTNLFGDSDSGALAYLDHLLNDTIRSRYRHVVVDEAQDISPIEFKLLSLSSVNNWFTILGDTAQRLTPYRGIRSWRNVERVFGRFDIEVQRARRSYRSTKQITTFTNRILRTFDRRDDQPIPFDREGERVQYSSHTNRNAMFQAIMDEIYQIRGADSALGREPYTIAVLARDANNLNAFEKFCVEREMREKIGRMGQDDRDGANAVIARILAVKGLEYDAVIIMGANDSFSDTLFNKKQLYLAATRAKHYLSIHWSGARSPILDGVSERSVVGWRRR